MTMYLGDFNVNSIVYAPFSTAAAGGSRVAFSSALEAADILVYKNGSATERSSTAGYTITSAFDSLVGVHMAQIDTSDNTDAGFYAVGNDYSIILYPDETVDTQTVAAVLACFSIENRSALRPTTAGRELDVSTGGEAGVDWANVGSPTTTVGLSGTTVATTTTATATTTVNGLAAGVITAASIATDAITAAKIADGAIDAATFATGAITAAAIAADAIGASELAADAVTEIQQAVAAGAVASVTGAVGSVTGAVGSVTGAVGSVTAVSTGAITNASFAAGAIDAAAIAANAIGASELAADAVDEILDEVVEGTTTLRQMLRAFSSALASKCSGMGTTTAVFRDIGDTKDRITATVDTSGNRTAITLDLT